MIAVAEPVLTATEMDWNDYCQQWLTPILSAGITDPEIFQKKHN